MFLEAKLGKDGLSVYAADLVRGATIINCKQDCNQTAHDVCVAVAYKV